MLYFKDDERLIVHFANGDVAVWSTDNPEMPHILELCKSAKWGEIEILNNINKALMSSKEIIIEDNTVKIDGVSVVNTDTPIMKFIKILQEKGVVNSEIERIKPFLENMFKNPFINAVQEIYDYCKAMDFEITDDGCFLAYKNVRKDLGSIYDNGATKHKIGEYTEVKMYDTERTNTCSNGLHFCSKSYLKHYTGDVTIIVKVNPMDVVSIPVDYNFAKGRCRKYLTVGILDDKNKMLSDVNESSLDKSVGTILRKESRIEEAVRLMKKYKVGEYSSRVRKVAKEMNVSPKTVYRYMQKYKKSKKDDK